MELRQLRYFVSIAENLHFRRAAEQLSIAQPALSQQIQKLERELGVRLLERTQRRVSLTDAGAVFLERARLTLNEAEEAVRLARLAGRGEIGHLGVGAVTSALYGVFPEVVRVFRERHRQVHLTLHELAGNEQTRALRDGRIQVSFLRPPIDEADIEVRTITREPWVVALPTAHRFARRSRVALKMLAAESFVSFPRDLAPVLYDQLISMCNRAGFSPRIVQEGQMQTIVSLVAAGIGVALVPATLENLSRRGVVYRPLTGAVAKLQLAVAWRRDNRSPLLEAFLGVVREMT
ncbi:MAG TPA: LysR substrate-binding domain-containing protein [Bryobacteraceae bacterium]|nr:LysR substrate-binding domain-containing protein [Bryobacteraceae bacterium]